MENFCYLGRLISDDGGAVLEHTLGNISTQLTKKVKLGFFKSNWVPVLLYVCEKYKRTFEKQIEVFVHRWQICWPDLINYEELWRLANVGRLKSLLCFGNEIGSVYKGVIAKTAEYSVNNLAEHTNLHSYWNIFVWVYQILLIFIGSPLTNNEVVHVTK